MRQRRAGWEQVFTGRLLYEYSDVPALVYTALLSAASKGRFFNTRIRGHFRFAVAKNA